MHSQPENVMFFIPLGWNNRFSHMGASYNIDFQYQEFPQKKPSLYACESHIHSKSG